MQDIEAALKDIEPPPSRESYQVAAYRSTQMLLARAGNLITPECYLAELRMIEQLDRVIDRCHDRLMKMKKDSKGNKAPPKRASSLTPSWAAGRR
jgi:hypothetical protein